MTLNIHSNPNLYIYIDYTVNLISDLKYYIAYINYVLLDDL